MTCGWDDPWTWVAAGNCLLLAGVGIGSFWNLYKLRKTDREINAIMEKHSARAFKLSAGVSNWRQLSPEDQEALRQGLARLVAEMESQHATRH